MKVLDESGVKKIVKDYKTADKTIMSNINTINNKLNGISAIFYAMLNRYNTIGFATYGVSNEESGLIIPIDGGQSNCYIIEGTITPFYCKIIIDANVAVVRTDNSAQTVKTLVETIEDDEHNKFLIVAQANVTEPVVIKPIIDKSGEQYYFEYSSVDEIDKQNGSLTDIENNISASIIKKFDIYLEPDAK